MTCQKKKVKGEDIRWSTEQFLLEKSFGELHGHKKKGTLAVKNTSLTYFGQGLNQMLKSLSMPKQHVLLQQSSLFLPINFTDNKVRFVSP